jgi:RHS repeat-associated protein
VFYADYDAENRLKSIEYSDSQSGQHHRLAFSYYYNDFLARVRTYVGQAQVADLRIVRSGYLPLQDRDGSNSVQRSYTWGLNLGGGIGGLLAVTDAGQHYQYLYDGKGNVSAVLDASAQPVASYRYDAFGKLLSKSGSFEQPFMFSTKRYFQGVGLSYYGYRFYQPVMGRWLTRDPLQEAGGINLYGFVQNNPVNYFDPYGLSFKDTSTSDVVGALAGCESGSMEEALLQAILLDMMYPYIMELQFQLMADYTLMFLPMMYGMPPMLGPRRNIVESFFEGQTPKVITNKYGDKIFMTNNRKVRFDLKNTHRDKPHVHFEKKVNGKWRDAFSKHRFYPKP